MVARPAALVALPAEMGGQVANSVDRYPALKDRALRRLNVIARFNADDNWDGEGAIGVGEGVIDAARKFIHILPEKYLPHPEEDIEALPVGEVAFDWHKDRNRMFMVSIGAGGRIAYSGLFEDGVRCRGYEKIADNRIPGPILAFIRRAL